MASGSPWAQPGNELGWGQGEGAIDPPTRQQQQEQENLELAIEAAAAVAPELIAEEQRQGGGGQQVEYQTDGMGQQAQGGDEPTVQVDTSLGAPPQDTSNPTSAATPRSIPQGWGSGTPPMQSMLGPLMQPNAVPLLKQAVRSGEARLNATLHRFYGDMRSVSAQTQGMRGFHFALPMLLGLAEEIGRDGALRSELRRMGAQGRSGLSSVARARVSRVIAENRPNLGGVKALESVMDWPVPGVRRRYKVIIDSDHATVSGTVSVLFADDFPLGNPEPDDDYLIMNNSAQAVQDAINELLRANTWRGTKITSNVKVIWYPAGARPPGDTHIFMVGGGAGDVNWDPDDGENPNISWAEKCGRRGYLYREGDAGHEFLHWLGLSDRYTEVVILTGTTDTGGVHGANSNDPTGQGLPKAQWGREYDGTPQALPLGKVRENEPDYNCMDNAMSLKGPLILTEYQKAIIFEAKCEEDYARDVIAYEVGTKNPDKAMAVEFDPSHTAYWWDVDKNSRVPNNSFDPGPTTLRHLGDLYFGQNFHRYHAWLYDVNGNNGTQISGKPLPEGSRNNREAVNIAIKMNR